VRSRNWVALAASGVLSLALGACGDTGGTGGGGGDSKLSGTVRIDGSSTVGPLSEAAAEGFQAENPQVRVTVGTSGTGGGFEKFCAGETDISDASRAIKPEERAACSKNGISPVEFQVANDGLSVVVNPQNTWATCLTTAHLKKIWDRGSTVTTWRQVDPKFPAERMELFGAGTDSGTFDFFTEAINGEEGRSRTNYNATEDDNVTVQGVSGSKGGIGYFGLSYFEQNKDKLKAVQVNDGGGCVGPSSETVQNGSYKPLSRPLFIYAKAASLKRPAVEKFVEYYLQNTGSLATKALFVPLTQEQEQALEPKLQQLRTQAKGTT
jgi:phosphate transport system substrate-binding protein